MTLTLQSRATTFGVDWAGEYSDYRCPVMKDGWYYHVYPTGRPCYVDRFDFVGSFVNGKALAKKDGEEFFINSNGKRVK